MHNSQSVSELNELIKSALDTQLEPTYWVVGEITDFRKAPQGHAYFELVEKSGNSVLAKIKATLWQYTYRTVAGRFESVTGTSLKTGMKVLAQVAINFHPLYGLSVNVKDIDPSFSLGERARIRQETIDRLTREGLLNLNSTKQIPIVLQKVAIVSSPTAAGYGDFIQQIQNNSSGYKVYSKLFPATMQGNDAVASIIKAIEQIEDQGDNIGFEAIIIIRGGGAQLDLDCFDDYSLAERIATSTLPIFTGIGHERDESIADLVAHTRLKTPTAVAEFILSSFREFDENLGLALVRLERITRQSIHSEKVILDQIQNRIKSRAQNQLSLSREKLSSIEKEAKHYTRSFLSTSKLRLENLEVNLKKAFGASLKSNEEHLVQKAVQLDQLDPKSIFSRGYTRTELEGIPIYLTKPKVGTEISTFSQTQKLKSTITHIESNE